MTAFRSLVFGVLVWTLLGASASAAPMSSSTPGAWAWWSTACSSPAASSGVADQIINSMSGLQTNVVASSPPMATPDVAGSSALRADDLGHNDGGRVHQSKFRPLSAGQPDHHRQRPTLVQQRQASSFFGGTPTAQQIASFDNTVLQRVQQTFQQSGVNVSLTTDPTVPATHTLSLVSNTTSNIIPGVIGMTQVTASGFSFFDQEVKSAQTLDQLEWIVGAQHLARADARVRGGRKLRPVGQLHRRPQCELVDDGQSQCDLQSGRGPGAHRCPRVQPTQRVGRSGSTGDQWHSGSRADDRGDLGNGPARGGRAGTEAGRLTASPSGRIVINDTRQAQSDRLIDALRFRTPQFSRRLLSLNELPTDSSPAS